MRKILWFIAGCCLLAQSAIAQTDSTSYFEIKLYNTANKLVSGKNVDLYQGVTKKYDLTESTTVPGVYSHATVKVGEYDIYVNTALWKSGLWIGANKVTSVADLFWFTSGPDTMRITGHIRATSFEGDGSKLTGIAGSVASAIGDLILGADSDDNGNGDVRLQVGGSDRLRIYNAGRVYFSDSSLVAGNANLGSTATSLSGIETQEDTTVQMSVNRIYGSGTGSRHGMLLMDDYNDVVSLVSGKTGTVPSGNAAWPLRFFIAGPGEVARMTTTGRIGIGVTNPAAGFLHIHTGASNGFNDGIALTNSVTGNTSSDGFHIYDDPVGGVGMMNREAAYLTLGTNDTDRLHIDQNGNVAISGSAPGTSLALDVVSTNGAFAPPRMTQTQRGALTASNGMQLYSTSRKKYYFRQNATWDSLLTASDISTMAAAGWNKATSTRIQPSTLTDTVRVNRLRLGASQTANYGLITDANGNISASALPMIGDTIEVSVFLDTTASNSGTGNAADLTRLGVRRSLTYWALDATNSDTLLFSLPIPEYAENLEYVVLPYRVNATSGNYFISLSWEFFSDDDAVDNSLTYTNNTTFSAPTAGTSGDWKLYRHTISSSATGSGRWIDGMVIRVGGNGSDTATGNMYLSTEIMLGWSRKRGY